MLGSGKRMLALAAVVLLAAAACRGGGDDGPGADGELNVGNVGIDGQTITIGQLSPLTGPVEVIGGPLTRGHEVYYEYVNEELGGVGRDLPEDERFTIRSETRDTQYTPDRHVEQFNAIRDDVLAIGQSLGTPTTKATLPQLQEDPILTGPATLSVEWLAHDFMFPAGAPYAVQIINGLQHFVNEGDEIQAGIIYQDDDYGQEGINGLEFAAEQLDFDIVARSAYRQGDQDFTAQVAQMRDAGATHVVLTATPSPAGGILGTAASLGYQAKFIGQSPIWAGALFRNEQLADYMRQNLWWVTDASCEWGDTGPGCEGMEEMLQNMETYAPDQEPDVYFLFGYTQAKLLHEILEQAISNGELTREGVIDAVADLEDVDIGGLLNPISYGPDCEDRVPVTASSIFRVDPEQPIAVAQEAEVDSDTIADYPFCPEE